MFVKVFRVIDRRKDERLRIIRSNYFYVLKNYKYWWVWLIAMKIGLSKIFTKSWHDESNEIILNGRCKIMYLWTKEKQLKNYRWERFGVWFKNKEILMSLNGFAM